MSSIKPEDRPKVIGLVGAIVVVFGVGGVNMAKQLGLFRSSAPAPEASTAAATPAPAPAPAGASIASGATGTVATASTLPLSNPSGPALTPGGGPDPFRPIAPTVTATPAAAAPAPAPAGGGVTVRQINPAGPVPVGGFPVVGPSPIVTPAPLQPAPVPEQPLELIGVITGPDAIAMIRANQNEHFLHRGDIVQGYRIVRIAEDAVTLRRGKLGRVLRVGAPASATVLLPETPVGKSPSSGRGSETLRRESRANLAQTSPAAPAHKAAPAPIVEIVPHNSVTVRHSPSGSGLQIIPMPAAVSSAPTGVARVREPLMLPSEPVQSGPALPVVPAPAAPPALPVAPVLPAEGAPIPQPASVPVEVPATLPENPPTGSGSTLR